MSNWKIEPFLHYNDRSIYNPLTHQTLQDNDDLYRPLLDLYGNSEVLLSDNAWTQLYQGKWLIDTSTDILSRYRLRVVTIEGTAHCNQHCNFCPVSTNPKAVHTMSLALYETIVAQLVEYKDTIEAVFMINYNEPTLDRFFIERISILKKYDLPICINTNGTGLTKRKIDQIRDLGRLRYLSVNLSSVREDYYREERKYNKLSGILKNLNYLSKIDLAEEMTIAVLGSNDDIHRENFQEIEQCYGNSFFQVKSFTINNRAGRLESGQKVDGIINNLKGCDSIGSRPLQHLLINSFGKCYICCQDYFEEYLVGDLNQRSVSDVLVGEEMKKIRGMTYGILDSPDDYICKKCVFALTCHNNK